ncbi:hypothetical protein JGG70_24330 [Salmonella enterica subsp. enterica serovar Typhimurium]|nr:hypothetical protein [Salmonella enterica subsp. enterica serovar Typhimurium]
MKANEFDVKDKEFISWDQVGVLHSELLQPGETISAERYRRQLLHVKHALTEKRPQYDKRHDKVILLHDNAKPHVAKHVQEMLETLCWDVLPHSPYSPDIAPLDFHLFRSLRHCLSEQHFLSVADIQKWLCE